MCRRLGKQGRSGTRIFRELLELRDAQYAPTESERELMLLRLIQAHGLPEPERQFSIYDNDGNFIARPDLVYRDLMIAIEYDSFQYHVGNAAHVRDNRRRNAMGGIGWMVLVATADDVRYGSGAQFVRDVRRARRRREAASVRARIACRTDAPLSSIELTVGASGRDGGSRRGGRASPSPPGRPR